jgi:hypothetical protein
VEKFRRVGGCKLLVESCFVEIFPLTLRFNAVNHDGETGKNRLNGFLTSDVLHPAEAGC